MSEATLLKDIGLPEEILEIILPVGLETVDQVLAMTEEDLQKIQGIGPSRAKVIMKTCLHVAQVEDDVAEMNMTSQPQMEPIPEDEPTGPEQPYMFVSRFDHTVKLGGTATRVVREPDGSYARLPVGKPVPLRFVGNLCTINQAFADQHGMILEDIVKKAQAFPSYRHDFFLVDGPGVRQDQTTAHFKLYLKRGRMIGQRGIKVHEGPR